jgi:endonuclease/exonuclease/phosphatase family metal-dependent hydrolase
VFCPTVTHGGEHYGHALLSRWPIETVKRSLLPGTQQGWHREPRAALWGRIQVGPTTLNVITTHLGLGRMERRLQVEALLGPEWLGALDPSEPALICGDFNMMPGSRPYGWMASRLRDIQAAQDGHRPLSTFSSVKPFTRIDHVFISPLLQVGGVYVPRTHLTRIASDHLPLVTDLQFVSAAVETPMHTPA